MEEDAMEIPWAAEDFIPSDADKFFVSSFISGKPLQLDYDNRSRKRIARHPELGVLHEWAYLGGLHIYLGTPGWIEHLPRENAIFFK